MKVAGVLVLANVTIKGANFWGLERRKNVVPIRSTFKVLGARLSWRPAKAIRKCMNITHNWDPSSFCRPFNLLDLIFR